MMLDQSPVVFVDHGMYTIGGLGRYIGRLSVDYHVDYRSTIVRLSVDYRSTIGQLLVNYRSTIGRLSVDYRSTIDQLSVDYWSTTG